MPTKTMAMRQAVEERNVPLAFLGATVDQDGRPLSAVTIDLRVRHWDMATFGGSIPMRILSDESGRFHIHGVSGDGFDLDSMTKAGYEAEPIKRSYPAVGGSYAEPVLFRLWATNVHEQLISGRKSIPMVPDGRWCVIDLRNGAVSDTGQGDLRVWVRRPPQVALGERYDWSCEIQILKGGLTEETNLNSVMFVAPKSGYTQSFSFHQPIESGWGNSTGTRRFFLALDDFRIYGRLSIELLAYYNTDTPGLVRLEYAINPSGSTILR